MDVATSPTSSISQKLSQIKPLSAAIRIRPDGDLAWVEFDQPNEKANKLSSSVLIRLREVIAELSKSKFKAAILISKKPSIFIAGADIEEIKTLKTESEAAAAAALGQDIFNELESLSIPVVAAIHGACVGGGCEMILACDYRICSDDSATKIGLPETLLGIIPGFGGTQRLPRMIGIQAALDIILAGKTVPGAKAKKLGLVDLCVPNDILEEQARKMATEAIAKGKKQKRFKPQGIAGVLMEGLARGVVFSQAKKMLLAKTNGNYPAPLAAIDVIQKTYGGDLKRGLKIENDAFGKVAVTDVSKNLINLFFMTENVKKATGVHSDVKPAEISSLAVLGAGTMGGGIAQLAAEKEVPVILKDVNHDAIEKGFKAARDIFKKSLKRKKITNFEFKRKMGFINGSTDYTGFKFTDVIIEAIVEDMNIKKKVLGETEKQCHDGVIIATNTSSLSVTEMGKDLAHPENFVGMHFFNPVHRMPLIEVIRSDKTNDRATATIFALSKKMGKTPVVVKDGPGFLVNRLLMPYLNEAVFMLGDGEGIEHIDKALLQFGMPMGPLHLVDEIGIDVAVKVAKILFHDLGSRAEPSPLMPKVVESKKLGKKNGSGFYSYDSAGRKGKADHGVYGLLALGSPKNKMSDEQIVHRALFPMINEAALCLEEKIVESPEMVDLAMIMGTGFPPFRGGILRWADTLGSAKIVSELEELARSTGPRFTPSAPLARMAKDNKKFYA